LKCGVRCPQLTPAYCTNSLIVRALLTLIFATVPRVDAAIEIQAEVDRGTLSVGESFTYTITLSGGRSLPEIEPPDFEGLEVVMGPSTSTNFQMVNGRISQSKSMTYRLRALRPGTLTIGPARARQGRRDYSSSPIQLEVLPTTGSPLKEREPPGGEATLSSPRKPPDLFVTACASKDTLYRLEMATVTYRLYLRVNVAGYEFTKLPQLTGFWQEEFPMPSRPALQDVTVRGTPFKMAVIRKIGLFPTRAGRLELEPLVMDCTVEMPVERRRRSRDIFDSFWDDQFFSRGRREVRTVSTEPLTLTVLDIPGRGRPADFRGDVGEFRLKVDYDNQTIAQHDALTVKVTINGTGYLKSVDSPELKLPSGFEQFDPTSDAHISLTDGKMRGNKTFTYLVIPRRPGSFILEPVIFSYFSPRERTYQRLKAGGLRLTVTPSEDETLAGYGAGPSEVTLLDSDIRFIQELGGPLTAAESPIYRSLWLYLSVAASPLLYLLGLGIESTLVRRAADPAAVRRRRAPDRMRRGLNEASRLAKRGDQHTAVVAAGHELAEMVGAIAGEPAVSLTGDLIERRLTDRGADRELMAAVMGLLSESDRVKFGSASTDAEGTGALLKRFKEAAGKLEKLL